MVKRVLIIDDEIYFTKLVKMNLEMRGAFSVDVAVKGCLGLDMADGLRPHLILLDLLMPDMNGLQVLEELKKKARTARIPVVVLSAKGDEPTRREVLDKGADLFVTKPIGAQELKETISRLLKAGPKKPAPVKNPGTGNRAKAKKKRR